MTENLLGQQIPIAIIAAGTLEWLKHQAWFPFVKLDSRGLNRAFAAVVALATAIGIHATFNSAEGVLTITGLHLAMVLHGLWAAVQQYALQHASYRLLISPPKGEQA